MEELQLKAMMTMLRASQHIGEFSRQQVKTYGLNITEFAVLELLFHKGDQPIQMIGKKILIASSSITYVVDKLEKKGYVKRTHCPSDRRVIYASLTDEGRAFIESIFPQHAAAMTQLFDGLDEAQLQQLIDISKQVGKTAEASY
ncbi:MAG: MarR family transcriptional regulator [Caryophanon sp.]|nr:MarR family transcriptional regulator [Caryophanon sp.]